MTRGISAAMVTASEAESFRPFTAIELNFSTGVLRFNSTPANLSFDSGSGSPSDDFIGVGQYGSISIIEESAELKTYSVDMQLRGIPNDIISSALGADYQGKSAKVWFGLVELTDWTSVIADPTLWFDGVMDTMDIALGEKATVTMHALSRFARWEQAPDIRYTNEEQQRQYAGDKGFEFVGQAVEKEVTWRVGG